MHLHFERIEKPHSFSDCNILTLSWMGKVPDGLLQTQDEDGWKLNRSNYYQDGWLASGNARGIVGVTYTMCRCRNADSSEMPSRTNYNLRGHRSDVTLVKWNEPYQKLASCDSSGIIFVWIKYEGRWSVELINDRNTQVTDFSWSHDGRMALICYVDGFVLSGSVSGQRYWSSFLNLDSCSPTCGIWTPDDQQVIFGTSNGSILVIDINGTLVTQLSIRDGYSIMSMAWSSEKFKMEDADDDTTVGVNAANRTYVLGIRFDDGVLYLLRNYDDIFPIIIRTNLTSIKMEWSNKGEILAVGGHKIIPSSRLSTQASSTTHYLNQIQFYNESGCLRYKITLEHTGHPITTLTWGHNDKRLFVVTGPVLHTAWVTKRIASLQLLCRLMIHKQLHSESNVNKLLVPNCIQTLVSSLFGRTIRCYLPDSRNLTKFVANPPNGNSRLYCTLIRHDNDHLVGESSASSYVLYLEYLGGLVPILKGRRTSKFRPEFVIFDPEIKQSNQQNTKSNESSNKKPRVNPSHSSAYYWHSSSTPGTSDSESEDSQNNYNVTLKTRRRRHQHRTRRNREQENTDLSEHLSAALKPESTYQDEMPENERLVLVTSNIWGTKFKILGLVPWLPTYLGSVAYRTSLLHLQPRQMTLKIKELGTPRRFKCFDEPLPNCDRSNLFTSSEDEDDPAGSNTSQYDDSFSIPIAPMTPKKTFQYQVASTNGLSDRHPDFSFSVQNSCRDSIYNPSSSNQNGYSMSDGQKYINMISHLNDDLLTLQLNPGSSDGNLVSLELTSVNSEKIYQNLNPKHSSTKPVTSASISTQTSFQSLNEFTWQNTSSAPEIQCNEVDEVTSDPRNFNFSATSPTRTDTFKELEQKYASELPCLNITLNRPFVVQADLISASESLDSGIGNSESSSQGIHKTSKSSPQMNFRGHRFIREKRTDSLRLPINQLECCEKMVSNSLKQCPQLSYRNPIACNLPSQHNTPPSTSLFHQYPSPTYSHKSFLHNFNQINTPENYAASPLSTSTTITMLSNYTTGNLTGGDGFVCSPTKLSNYEWKFIDDQEIDDNSELCQITHSVTRSPSFLFYRNRSSIAQCHHLQNHTAHHSLHSSCTNNSHSYANEFANIRTSSDSNSLANQTSQRRYTLFNGKKEQHQTVLEHNLISQNTLTKKNKERPRNCMSLDDEESDFENIVNLSWKLCKFHQGDEYWNESNKNRRNFMRKGSNGSGLSPSSSILDAEFDDYGSSLKQSLLSSPVHRIKRKLLSFDSKELLNSLNEGNHLLKENSYSYRKGNNQNYHEISLSSGRTLSDERISRRGSLTQALISADSKSFGSEMINRSLPASPLTERKNRRRAQGKSIFYSPTMFRKVMKQKLNYLDCSSEDDNSSDDDVWNHDFKNLGAFQRSSLKRRIKVKRRSSRIQPDEINSSNLKDHSGREFVLHNKAPLWNEVNQVYQLDFGGRVTQESAKNFQIEHQGKQVMQFGRIDDNAYTIDFQYPFSALQALAVALANITQRLK